MGSLIIVLLTTRSVAIPGAPHCRRWAEASGFAPGPRYAGTPVRLADKADVVKPPSAGEPLYCNAYLQVVSVKQALRWPRLSGGPARARARPQLWETSPRRNGWPRTRAGATLIRPLFQLCPPAWN